MTRIREAILVEGRYDVNTVRQVVDTVVLESGGFRIFNNKDQLKLLRRIAETRGLIVLTDSDGAGFVIRNYLKGALPKGCVKQAYVPDIAGKERRKRHGSKEGKLGVEGMRPQVILDALRRAVQPLHSRTRAKRAASGHHQGGFLRVGAVRQIGQHGTPRCRIARAGFACAHDGKCPAGVYQRRWHA